MKPDVDYDLTDFWTKYDLEINQEVFGTVNEATTFLVEEIIGTGGTWYVNLGEGCDKFLKSYSQRIEKPSSSSIGGASYTLITLKPFDDKSCKVSFSYGPAWDPESPWETIEFSYAAFNEFIF